MTEFSMGTPHSIDLDHLGLSLGAAKMEFSLKVEPGEWLAVVGPSGAGKTTMLNLIGGFVTPESGQLTCNGTDLIPLPPHKRPITTLFQEHNLFAHMSAGDNVGLGLDPGLRLSKAQSSEVTNALARVGLADRATAKPANLSGGERQRVALARALVRKQPILLLDEPLGQLDPALRIETLGLIANLQEENQLTVLMVLHTPEEAAGFVDRFAYLEDGRVAASFTPDDFAARALPPSVLQYLGEQGR